MPTTNKPGALFSVTIDGKTFHCGVDEDSEQDKNLGRWDRPEYSKPIGTIDTSTLTDDDIEFLKRHASGGDNANN